MADLSAAQRTSADAPAGLGGRMLNGRHVKMFKPVPSHALAKLKAARGEGSRRLAGHRAPPSVDDPEPARKRRRTPGTMHALNPNLYDKHNGVRQSPFPLPFPPPPPISDHCHISSRGPTDGLCPSCISARAYCAFGTGIHTPANLRLEGIGLLESQRVNF